MTKKTFIKKLKEKLSILDSDEVKDIIEEYESTIDEKIKNGEDEKQAISDFGNIDELAKEILKAYKINPKYTEEMDEDLNIREDFEGAIKKGASKLADFTKGIIDDIKNQDGEFTVETIFELVLKALALLLIIGVLRLPFWMLTEIGESLLDVFFFPLDKVLIVVWHLLMWIVYFAVCVLIAIAIFKNNIKSNHSKKKETIKVEPKNISKEEIVKEKEVVQEVKKEPKKQSGISDVLIIIAKVFITLVVTIPLIFVSIGLAIAIAFMIYFCFIGINLVGPICILIAIFIMVGYIADIFGNIFKNKKRHFLAPIIVSAVFLVLGITLTFIKATDYQYYETLDKAPFELKVDSKEYVISYPTKLELNSYLVASTQIDDTLEDGKIRIDYSYYDEVTDIYSYERRNRIEIDVHTNIHHNDRITLYHDVIENLKKDKFYNYKSLFDVEVVVYGNSKTLNLITFD